MPATWVAAVITALGGVAGAAGTMQNIYSDGTELSLTVTQARYQALTVAQREQLRGIRHLQIRSGTGAAAVNQTATRTVIALITNGIA